jgi:predicted NUDIX family NTP pyrophosphohydrolase
MRLQVHRSGRRCQRGDERPAWIVARPSDRVVARLGYDAAMVLRQSAGILLFRRRLGPDGGPEVLLAHPGGPFFAKRDEGHWTIPKGEPDGPDEDLLAVARREFAEEVGHPAPPAQPDGSAPIELGSIVQKGGKVVHAWAIEGDLDPDAAISNQFEMVWPPGSGRLQSFPEIDRVAWFDPLEASRRLKPTQIPFIERLIERLSASAAPAPAATTATSAMPTKPDGS